MIGIATVLKFFSLNKIAIIAVGVLLASTAAAGILAKHYYDKDVLAGEQINVLQQEHELAIASYKERLEFEGSRYEALAVAFARQKKRYERSRRETIKLRGMIDELKHESPEVSEYLGTPMPTELYDRMFPPNTD